MRSFAVISVVFCGLCAADLKEAVASGSSSWAVAVNAGYAGGFDLHTELAFDAVLIGSLPIAPKWVVYAEAGLGYSVGHEQFLTVPIGGGVWHELLPKLAVGFTATYGSRLGHFFEGVFLVGPFFQYTLFEHAGPLGHTSILAIPGLAGQVSPEHASALGWGLTTGMEIALF